MGGGAYIKTLGARHPQKLDPNAFKPKSGGKLDTVSEGNIKKLKKSKGSSLLNIVKYKPIHLKKLSSETQATFSRRKENAAIREAQSAIVKEKVQSVRKQNPFNDAMEKQAGKNLSTVA